MLWMVRFVPESFLDPGEDGWGVDDAFQQLGFVLALAAVLWALFRFFLIPAIRKIVIEEVQAATVPIQRHANGGYSLPDVARKGDWTAEAVKAIGSFLGADLPVDTTMDGNIPHDKQDD